MSDSDTPEIDVFGTTYEIDDAGKIHPQHTLSPRRAKQLEESYPAATSLQAAIRMACRDALDERRRILTAEYFDNQTSVEEVAKQLSELSEQLDAIEDAVVED